MGEDAMCWSSIASPTQEGGIPFPNGVLVANFSLSDKVDLLPNCPNETYLEAFAPPEFLQPGFRPRTLEWYNYTIKGRLNVADLNGMFVASDNGARIAVGIIACDSVTAGFCSPFVHEQANIRLGRERAAAKAADEAAAKAADEAAAKLAGTSQSAPKTEAPTPAPGPPPKKVPGNRHGGTHVHSPAVMLDIPEVVNVTYEFEIQVPVIINHPGHFFVIGKMQFFTGDTTTTPVFRYDVSNALIAEERYVVYQEPAMILEVTHPVRTIAYVSVGVTSAVLFVLIFQLVKHYNHQIMKISQGPFLLLFLLAALTATVSTILLEPKSSLWCNVSQPLILIPLQLLYAISLGRLWRIHAVVSPLLRGRIQRAATKHQELDNCFTRLWTKARSAPIFKSKADIRREVSASKMAYLIAACTAPQIIIQALSWWLQPQEKRIEYNEDQSIGRCICDDGAGIAHSLVNYSLYMLLLLVCILLIMAHVSRKLPSLLNESAVIYDTTLISVLLLILGAGVESITNSPTTSPDVAYIINTVLVLSITLNSTLRIMMPKLNMVWSGQQVLVSQLVSDHRQSLRQSATSRASEMYNVTGLEPTSRVSSHHNDSHEQEHSETAATDDWGRSSGLSSAAPRGQIATGSSTISDDVPTSTNGENHLHHLQSHSEVDEEALDPVKPISRSSQEVWLENVERSHSQLDHDEEQPPPQAPPVTNNKRVPPKRTPSRVCFAETEKKESKTAPPKRKMVIRQGEAPSKQLVLRMVDLHSELDHVNSRIMSGMNVEPEDWETLRKLTARLEGVFSTAEFEWEKDKQQPQQSVVGALVEQSPKNE